VRVVRGAVLFQTKYQKLKARPVHKAINNAATAPPLAKRIEHVAENVRRLLGEVLFTARLEGPIADNSYRSQQRQCITSVRRAQTCSKLLHDANHQNS
jgi:hypothetical protein